MQHLTRVTGTGFAIGWSKDNWDAWERAIARSEGGPGSGASGFRSMLGTLGALFPGSVRVVERLN